MPQAARKLRLLQDRTPARDDLDSKIKESKKTHEIAATERRKHDSDRDQEERAREHLRATEDALLEFDQGKAQAAGQSWPPRSPSPEEREERRARQEDADAAKRVLAAVQQRVQVSREPADLATLGAQRIAAEIAPLVDVVLVEEAVAAIAGMNTARAEAAKLEAAVRSISAALAVRKAYRQAERIAVTVNTAAPPECSPNAAPYLVLAERLSRDADATLGATP